MKITKARFITTVASKENILNNTFPEVAFVGRSNVGKSSLINALTNQKALAKTSSTPGKTKHINYFLINEEFYLVDLPGYGYHKASKSEEKNWITLINEYLTKATNLKGVFVLLDLRRTPSEHDKQMLSFLNYYRIPFIIVATKIDKFAKSKRHSASLALSSDIGVGLEDIIYTSSEQKLGLEPLLEKIKQILGQAS